MRTILLSSSMTAVLLICIIGITACDNAHQMVDSSVSYQEELPPLPFAASSTDGTSSDEFTIQSSSSGSNTSLATSNGSDEDLSMEVSSTNSGSVTGILSVTTESLSPSSDPQKINASYEVYHNLPQHVPYNGYYTINYEVAGTSYSYGFNSEQRQILTDLQQELNEANEPVDSGSCSSTEPCQPSVQSSIPSLDKAQSDIFEKMTELEIIQWLEKLGYQVKKLDGVRFQVTRKYTKGEGSLSSLSITSVFDASTSLFEPGYTAYRGNVKTTEYLSKVDKQTGRIHALSKIMRREGMDVPEYLLMDIIRKENL